MTPLRVEVVFWMDTTGSMSPCGDHVRRRIEDTLTTLFKEIPDLKIGIGANGDYCDRLNPRSYVTKRHDLSTDIHSLCQFVRNVGKTDGGDLPECYELVLYEASAFNWSHNASKIFILIADDVPHAVHDPQNRAYNGGVGLDWRKGVAGLRAMNIVVDPIQCLSKGRHADAFYSELAEFTGGCHLRLDQFSEVVDLIMAVCYQQAGEDKLQGWTDELERSGRVTRSMDENLARLGKRKVSERFTRAPRDLQAVPPGRFQMLYVDPGMYADHSDGKIEIREFVADNDLEFRPGRGFYEFTKSELIQEKKEVVLRHRETGDMFTGEKARAMIGLRPGERARVKPAHLAEYHVFVQSTSYTRKLVVGTNFLYEVDLDR